MSRRSDQPQFESSPNLWGFLCVAGVLLLLGLMIVMHYVYAPQPIVFKPVIAVREPPLPKRVVGWAFGDVATGSALTTSEVGYVTLPRDWATCTITGWHIMANAGTATVKTARVTGGFLLPTLGSDSISTSGVSLSTGTLVNSADVADFTSKTLSAGDTLGFFLTAVRTAKQVAFQLDCEQL